MSENISDEHRAEHRAVTRKGPGQPPYELPEARVAEVVEACRLRMPETGIARAVQIDYRAWRRPGDDGGRASSARAAGRQTEEEDRRAILLARARKREVVPRL